MLSGLGEHLDSYIVGDHILFDKRAAELILCFRRSREAYLDLLEAYLYEMLEKLQLLLKAHWDNKCLISVSQVYRTPYGCFVDAVLLCPFHTSFRRKKITHRILFEVFHTNNSFLSCDKSFVRGNKKSPSPEKQERRACPCYHSHSHTAHAAYLSHIR